MSDRVDAAIAAADAAPAGRSWAGQFRLPSTGRVVQMVVPADLAPIEAVEIVAFVATELPRQLEAARANDPRSRILVPQ